MKSTLLKAGNESRTYRPNKSIDKTPISLLFLHGFTASPGELSNFPETMSDSLSANLYVHRWPGHGNSDPNAMQGITVKKFKDSAVEALYEAQKIGQSVIVIGSSLGATLGLWLAATFPRELLAVIAWSPGVQAANRKLLDEFCNAIDPIEDTRPRSNESKSFWSETVHPDGYRALRSLFQEFEENLPWPRVRCPVFLGYYRAAGGEEDQTASVPAMLEMFDALGTESSMKIAVPFDTGAHAIGSPYKTDAASLVMGASLDFLQRVIKRI